jgi:WD40 repeat protein
VSGGIRIWRWRGHTNGRSVKALDGFVKARFNPDGKLILASTPMYFHGGHRSPNHSFPPESAAVVSADSGELVATIDESVYEASWSPDGKEIVATLKSDKALRTYDAATGERLRTFPNRTPQFTISQVASSGRRLVAFSRDGALRVMDFKSGEEDVVTPLQGTFAMGAGFSRDASLIAVATGFRIEIWETRSGTEISSLRVPGHWLKRFAFSADKNRLYVGGHGGLLMEVDVASGKETKRFVGHVGAVLGIAVSPDERQIVSGDDSSGRVIIWDVASGQQLLTLTDGGPPIISLDWSSDGHRIVAGKEDGTVQIWALTRSQ